MNLADFDKTASYLPDVCFARPPDLGVLLGSGWGDALDMDEVLFRASYADLPGLGASTVQGHAGEFVLYRRGARLVAAWCGRRHRYEGVSWECVVTPVEILRRMGAKRLLLTNAAGGINPALRAGDFMVVKDHLNLFSSNPLVGPHCAEWGARFPDMTNVYSTHLSECLLASARRCGARVMEGVYAYRLGPTYETPAEIRAYKALGADAIGMSTVPEATFAHACGLDVAALSLVSNVAAGLSSAPLDHREVMAAGAAAKPLMKAIFEDFIDRL